MTDYDGDLSMQPYKTSLSIWTPKLKKSSILSPIVRYRNDYNDILTKHLENYSVETTALHRKLQSKTEALRILRKELEKFRTERDQFKLMAETLLLRYTALRRNDYSEFAHYDEECDNSLTSNRQTCLAKILHDTRERNIKLTTEVETLKQKLIDIQGDIEILRTNRYNENNKTSLSIDHEKNECFIQWKKDRLNLIDQLEQSKKKVNQLSFDLKIIFDEKEELTIERDAYKCKVNRLNHELRRALKATDIHPQFLDIDSIVLENKYLQERILNISDELNLTKQFLDKYQVIMKSTSEYKHKKGNCKSRILPHICDDILSRKQIECLLETDVNISMRSESLEVLKSICFILIDNLNDTNLVLNHQKRTNKILADRLVEFEQRLKSFAAMETDYHDKEEFSAAKYLLQDYNTTKVNMDKIYKNNLADINSNDSTFDKCLMDDNDKQATIVTENNIINNNANSESIHSIAALDLNDDSISLHDTLSNNSISDLSIGSNESIISSEYEINDEILNLRKMPQLNHMNNLLYKTDTNRYFNSNSILVDEYSLKKIMCSKMKRQRIEDFKDLSPELATLVYNTLDQLDSDNFDLYQDENRQINSLPAEMINNNETSN